MAHTERFGGAWLPTRYDDVASIAYDTERFSSRAIVISNFRPPLDLAPVGGTPPISSDPPFHHDARKLLLPAFTKTAIGRYEESTRAYCNSLIDAFDTSDGRGVVDAAQDYAKYIPMRVIGDMLGLPAAATRRCSRSSSRTCSAPSTCRRKSAASACVHSSTTSTTRSATTSITRAMTSRPT